MRKTLVFITIIALIISIVGTGVIVYFGTQIPVSSDVSNS